MDVHKSSISILAFSSIVLSCVFLLVLGSKIVLSSCERNEKKECITIDWAADVATEIAQLNVQLDLARNDAAKECTPPNISSDDWNAGDPKVLEGCWQLQHDYTMYYGGDVKQPNALIDWGFCLEAAGGYAEQNLYFEDGLQCLGQRIYYNFINDQGVTQLRLTDQRDIPCTKNGIPSANVNEREISCSLNPSGTYAECKSSSVKNERLSDGLILRRRQ